MIPLIHTESDTDLTGVKPFRTYNHDAIVYNLSNPITDSSGDRSSALISALKRLIVYQLPRTGDRARVCFGFTPAINWVVTGTETGFELLTSSK